MYIITKPYNFTILDNRLVWDHWMCTLANSLSSTEWQLFWKVYASFFGLHSLPTHLLSFFAGFFPEVGLITRAHKSNETDTHNHNENGIEYGQMENFLNTIENWSSLLYSK